MRYSWLTTSYSEYGEIDFERFVVQQWRVLSLRFVFGCAMAQKTPKRRAVKPKPYLSSDMKNRIQILGILSIIFGSFTLVLSNIPCMDHFTGGFYTAFILVSIGLGSVGAYYGIRFRAGWIVPVIGVVISLIAWLNQGRVNTLVDDRLRQISDEIKKDVVENVNSESDP